MDAQELELKHREFRLDKWKTIISILTPLVLVLLTYVVNNAIQERGALLKREEQILAEKQKIYAELGRNLNVIFVYVADVGDFSQYTPVEIVKKKREADRLFYIYRPYWSEATEHNYNVYMEASFQTYNGVGIPAKINSSKSEKVAAYQRGGLRWEVSWDQYFTEKEDPDISSKYYTLVGSLLADTVNVAIRHINP